MITIWTETLPESYWWTPTKYIGGTPEYVINTAENLVKLGRDVIVYYDGMYVEHNGVSYFPREAFNPSDTVLHCNEIAPRIGTKNISWTSKFGQTDEMYRGFDLRITMSEYHKSLFGDSVVISLSCDTNKLKPRKKRHQAIYTSSPDRGLDFLLKIWPEVYDKTGLELKTSYGASQRVLGVNNLGIMSEKQLNRLYQESEFWLHPCQGIELFCISGYKAQVAGCWPIVIPHMALSETIKYGTFCTEDNYKEKLIEAVSEKHPIPKYNYPSWYDVTKILDDYIKSI